MIDAACKIEVKSGKLWSAFEEGLYLEGCKIGGTYSRSSLICTWKAFEDYCVIFEDADNSIYGSDGEEGTYAIAVFHNKSKTLVLRKILKPCIDYTLFKLRNRLWLGVFTADDCLHFFLMSQAKCSKVAKVERKHLKGIEGLRSVYKSTFFIKEQSRIEMFVKLM